MLNVAQISPMAGPATSELLVWFPVQGWEWQVPGVMGTAVSLRPLVNTSFAGMPPNFRRQTGPPRLGWPHPRRSLDSAP